MRMSAEFLPDCRTCGISISSKAASCIVGLNSLYRSQSQYAFFTTMLPLSSSRSSTWRMLNFAYFASRTPSATFSKSQKTARLRSRSMAMWVRTSHVLGMTRGGSPWSAQYTPRPFVTRRASMARPVLVIGNKNYSSWSLRPWLLLKVKSIAFDEVRVPLYQQHSKAAIRAHAPAGAAQYGKVPILRDGDVTVWDS